jgi:hypothetical protein
MVVLGKYRSERFSFVPDSTDPGQAYLALVWGRSRRLANKLGTLPTDLSLRECLCPLLIQGGRAYFSKRFHTLFLFASLLLLPVVPSTLWRPRGGEEPTWRVTSAEDDANAVYESTWMLVDRTATPNPTVSNLAESKVDLPQGTSAQIENQDRVVRPWTDDYSSLLEVVK